MSENYEQNIISLQLLEEFSTKIVDRYFGGDIGKALVDLMEKTLIEEELYQAHLEKGGLVLVEFTYLWQPLHRYTEQEILRPLGWSSSSQKTGRFLGKCGFF